jgi:hypothetical protein
MSFHSSLLRVLCWDHALDVPADGRSPSTASASPQNTNAKPVAFTDVAEKAGLTALVILAVKTPRNTSSKQQRDWRGHL